MELRHATAAAAMTQNQLDMLVAWTVLSAALAVVIGLLVLLVYALLRSEDE